MTCAVVKTRAGSWAMLDVEAGEVMHPGVGPLVEAQQLYVQQSRLQERLIDREAERLVLFDVGLGAGSNAVAAWLAAAAITAPASRLCIVSFERDLTAIKLALEHAADFGISGNVAQALQALLKDGVAESAHAVWHLRHGDLLPSLASEEMRADVIYWDPFSPKTNPDLWTVGAFSIVRAACGPRAQLFTYSASTTVRVAMLLGGWCVGVGDAIGDKRATTAAAVRLEDLRQPLPASWLRRLSLPEARLPADASADALAQVHACPQFEAP